MADELVQIENLCCNLIANAENREFVKALLASVKGKWHRIHELLQQTGAVANDNNLDDLFVAWLDDAVSSRDFVSIIFHDYETMWTMCAHYNRSSLSG